MSFIHSDLGQCPTGRVVQFTLSGTSANVRLLDSSNFRAYQQGRAYRGVMARAVRSPVHLRVPHGGHWHAVVDLGQGRGHVRASIGMLPG